MSKGWVAYDRWTEIADEEYSEPETYYWNCGLCHEEGSDSDRGQRYDDLREHIDSPEHRDRMNRCNVHSKAKWKREGYQTLTEWGPCLLPPDHPGKHQPERWWLR